MALLNNKQEVMAILRQACEQFRGTKQDHLYIEAALKFVDDNLGPHIVEGEEIQAEVVEE